MLSFSAYTFPWLHHGGKRAQHVGCHVIRTVSHGEIFAPLMDAIMKWLLTLALFG